MAEKYFQHTFGNGLTLLCEKMPGMQSAAMSLLLAAGASNDPEGKIGAATVLAEMTLRGAGKRDSRQLTDYLDSLGLQRSSGVGVHHTRYACAAVADKVIQSLETYADIVQRPHLPEAGFTAARDLALQSLAGIDDEPRQKLMLKLREKHWPKPFNRNSMGVKEDLEKLSLDFCKSDFQNRFQATDAILSMAGNIDFERVKSAVEKSFGKWKSNPPPPIKPERSTEPYHFELQKSEQTHIGIAYPSVPETHAEYYNARLAVEVLSGGMSGRLFTEIREKRALCYSVGASYSSLKGYGSIFGYAGTSNERAQATLDCLVVELHRLSEGITQEELDRAKIGLKASIIMSSESTSARAGAIAHDYFIRGRIRSLDEISKALEGVTVELVNAYLKKNRPGPFTIVIVGPKELKLPQ